MKVFGFFALLLLNITALADRDDVVTTVEKSTKQAIESCGSQLIHNSLLKYEQLNLEIPPSGLTITQSGTFHVGIYHSKDFYSLGFEAPGGDKKLARSGIFLAIIKVTVQEKSFQATCWPAYDKDSCSPDDINYIIFDSRKEPTIRRELLHPCQSKI